MQIAESELILNNDGSIYHLNLRPEHISKTIITVGDPDRVSMVTDHFDSVEVIIRKREFHTQTGYYKGKRLSVISTGIGTDNIDIVINELDALVNIDLVNRVIKEEKTSLDIIRIGTSGAIQKDIPLDSFLISEIGIGFDNLLHFYDGDHIREMNLENQLSTHLGWSVTKPVPYAISANTNLIQKLSSDRTVSGITLTNSGFYGPQGRILRSPLANPNLNNDLESFLYQNKKITNLEMETSGIYGLSKLLGHNAISMNAIIANRALGTFSQKSTETIQSLIAYTLDKIVDSQN